MLAASCVGFAALLIAQVFLAMPYALEIDAIISLGICQALAIAYRSLGNHNKLL